MWLCYFVARHFFFSALVDVLNSDLWVEAIGNSQYFESVLNVKVPTMTSNTKPSGEASASSTFDENTKAYHAFDKVSAGITFDYWHSAYGNTTNQFVGYAFETPVIVKKVTWESRYNYSQQSPATYKIQASNDNFISDIIDLTGVLTNNDFSTSPYFTKSLNIQNNTPYKSYRMFIISGNLSTYLSVGELQFYGRSKK